RLAGAGYVRTVKARREEAQALGEESTTEDDAILSDVIVGRNCRKAAALRNMDRLQGVDVRAKTEPVAHDRTGENLLRPILIIRAHDPSIGLCVEILRTQYDEPGGNRRLFQHFDKPAGHRHHVGPAGFHDDQNISTCAVTNGEAL